MKYLALVCCFLSTTVIASSEYDFDYGDKNKMRGAWTACATTGFTEGDCPTVYEKCWQSPMTHHHGDKTYCTDPPDFSVSDDDKNRYLEEASKRAQGIINGDPDEGSSD
jgi:hypothetical protein